MKLRYFFLAAVSALSLNAQATTTDWGTHDTLEFGVGFDPAGSFNDSFLFHLSAPAGVTSATVANNLTSILGISGGTVKLFKEAGAVDTLLGSYSFDGTTGSQWHPFPALASGDYYYDVSGVATGLAGGFYSITSTLTPVPEPQTYAMLLAGLIAAGIMLRRRSPT